MTRRTRITRPLLGTPHPYRDNPEFPGCCTQCPLPARNRVHVDLPTGQDSELTAHEARRLGEQPDQED